VTVRGSAPGLNPVANRFPAWVQTKKLALLSPALCAARDALPSAKMQAPMPPHALLLVQALNLPDGSVTVRVLAHGSGALGIVRRFLID
jgi:hypothetical protein